MSDFTWRRSVHWFGALLGVVVAVGAAREARAVVLAYEGFNYPAGTLLVDNAGVGVNGGTGWAGAWDSTQGVNPVDTTAIQAGSLTYTDGLGNSLTTSGGKLFNTGASGTISQPGRTFAVRRDGVTLGATATTPVSTWVSFLAIRQGNLNAPGTTPANRENTFARGANLSLFDNNANLGIVNEEKLNFGENSNFQYPYTTGDDLLAIQRAAVVDPAQIELWKERFGKPSALAMEGYDVWMVNAPRVQAGVTAQAGPGYDDPNDNLGPITAAVDWHVNPATGRFQAAMTDTPFGRQVSLMVARIDHFGGDAPRDKVTVWMNPSLNAAPSNATADAVIDMAVVEDWANSLTTPISPAFSGVQGNVFSFDRLRLFAGQAQLPSEAAEWSLDELRFGESFGDVTPHSAPATAAVPEPGSLVLAAMALAGARGFRRRS